jgi:Fe-S-cluster containining protein
MKETDMPDQHDRMLQSWRENAARDENRNFRFLRSLKMVSDPDGIDALAGELHEDVFSQIDCTRCANCCKTIQPGFTDEDIARIAAHLGMSEENFVAVYLETTLGEGNYQTKAVPCPFLGEDDRCTISEVRPEGCRDFPHTDKEGFTRRVYLHAANTLSCPVAYHVVKQLRRCLRQH